MQLHQLLFFFFFVAVISVSASVDISGDGNGDASALLLFKLHADTNKTSQLNTFTHKTAAHFCHLWDGVRCEDGRVVHLVLDNKSLSGVIAAGVLDGLDQLRLLSLKNNHLHGTIPDLSPLYDLKFLFLSNNNFSGKFPSSVALLRRLRVLDLASNSLTGDIPPEIGRLARLSSLLLEDNLLNGTVPVLNQSSLIQFNVSGNLLSGRIPPELAKFNVSSFVDNLGLCGEPLPRICLKWQPFFPAGEPFQSPETEATGAVGQLQNDNIAGGGGGGGERLKKKGGLLIALIVLGIILSLSSFILLTSTIVRKCGSEKGEILDVMEPTSAAAAAAGESAGTLEKRGSAAASTEMVKSGKLVFCREEEDEAYSLDDLLRASAEMLGRGTVGITYKASMEQRRRVVTVKRLDASAGAAVSKEAFMQRMEALGRLRHPNLVPLRAYMQAKEERLLVYDFQPNGSLFSLIHGSRAARAKPLHWTSCLKIAEDVGRGLSYIHSMSKFFHGNVQSPNVLLGADFEARLTDYGLSIFQSEYAKTEDNPYRAPESNGKGFHLITSKSDVYSFGILIFELLAGKIPSRSLLANADMKRWVKSVREDGTDDYEEYLYTNEAAAIAEQKLEMMVEIAMECVRGEDDARPTMREVMFMIDKVKEIGEMEAQAYS